MTVMQRVKLLLDHPRFYCPVTGTLVHSEETSHEPSAATVFSFVDYFGEFQHLTPELREIWEQIEAEAAADDEDCDNGDLFERFLERMDNDSIVCFSISTIGMDCSYEPTAIHIAINMNYNPDEE
jgi:hypothetical protein